MLSCPLKLQSRWVNPALLIRKKNMVTLKGLDSSKIQSDQSQDQTEKLTEVGHVMSYQVITGNRKNFRAGRSSFFVVLF